MRKKLSEIFRREKTACIILGIIWLFPLFKFWAWTQQDNVQEGAIRYLSTNTSKGIFVDFDGRDPAPAFLKRFGRRTPFVAAYSQSRFVPFPGAPRGLFPPPGRYVHALTGQPGTPSSLNRIRWLGPFIAQIEVNGIGGGHRYTLIWLGRWRVVQRRMTYIV